MEEHKTKTNQISSDRIANFILNSKGNCKIFGSYVYKRQINGEEVNDIDCMCENIEKTASELVDNFGAIPKNMEDSSGYIFNDYTSLEIPGVNKLKVDLISKNDANKQFRSSFINNTILTKNGIEHSDYEFNRKQLEFIQNNLNNRRYCPWANMRLKDRLYFKEFDIIDKNICQKYEL